jgi:multidrug efflux pump subunit AcrB
VDWTPGAKRAPDAWQKAAKIYEVTLQQSPDYRMAINYGRTLGFLQQWADAARVYSDLFQQEQVVDQKAKNKLDRTAMSAKPELVMAYIELGTAERIASQGGSDKERSTRAMTVLTIAKNTLRPDVLPHEYWAANYQLARVLIDRGEYKNAQLSIEDITRNVSADYDGGKFGYKQRFLDTVEELKKK